MAALAPIGQAVTWIGFDDDNQLVEIVANIGTMIEVASLTEKDISDLSDSYAKRSQQNGRIIFGLQRTKRLKAFIHWVQDFRRINKAPSLDGLDEDSFRAALIVAADRATVRKEEASTSETIAREASPGKLKDERKWDIWAPAFENMLSTMPGVMGVPLAYVIREDETPEEAAVFDNFVQQCVACSPLTGSAFEADARQVHQLILSLVQGEQAEQWIKPFLRAKNGRQDMIALRNHFEGEGNTTRRIAEAERLRSSLHYKGERMMSFQGFLSKAQFMFNLFEKEGEEYSEAMKLRFLLERVQHPELKAAIAAIKVANSRGEETTFTTAANHLASELSSTQDFQTSQQRRSNVSVITQGEGSGGIYRDGKIFTGFHKDWNKLSKEDRDKVEAERVRLGVSKRRPKKSGHPGARRRASATRLKKEIQELKDSMDAKVEKKVIAAMKRVSKKSDLSEDESDEEVPMKAGDAFGGRNSKKSKK